MSDGFEVGSPYNWYWMSMFPLMGYPLIFVAVYIYTRARNLKKRGQKCMATVIKKYHNKYKNQHFYRVDYKFSHDEEEHIKKLVIIPVAEWQKLEENLSTLEIIYDPHNLDNNIWYKTYIQNDSKNICGSLVIIICAMGIILGFGLGFGVGLLALKWYHVINITFILPIIAWCIFYVLFRIGLRFWKKNCFRIPEDATEEQQNIIRYSVHRIFAESLGLSLSISLAASGLIGLQYFTFFLSVATVGSPYSGFLTFIALLPLRLWLKVYGWFLSGYNSYILNLKMVNRYKLEKIVTNSTGITFICSFCGWLIIVIVWFVYFAIDVIDYYDAHHNTDTNFDQEFDDYMNDKLDTLTSTKSAYSWSIAILMTPVWIFAVIYIMVGICTYKSVEKRINSGYDLKDELLINDDEEEFNLVNNWTINKKLICRVVLIHLLLLFTWIIWKWLTEPNIFSDNNGDVVATRDNALLSYWSLYIFTTIIKYICKFLVNIKNKGNEILLFEPKRFKTMIDILTSILFAFGLKFVFSNIKEWRHFVIISAINMVLKIFINGSFQSHQYGKRVINHIKKIINNKCGCECKIDLIDFNKIDEIITYNSDLAFNLSLNFLISTSSSLIMMTYFGLMMAIYSVIINYKVFVFMAASFGIDCITYFGQIITFKKRDRKYFSKLLWEEVAKNINGKKKPFEAFSTLHILSMSLVLGWFWIGSITVGPPADFTS